MSSEPELLIVGSNKNTGGIQRYIDQQKRHLSEDFAIRVYDTEVTSGSGLIWLLSAVLWTILDCLMFPFRRRPDLVHVHSGHWYSFYRATFYILWTAYIWRLPVVLHVHGSSFDEFVESDRIIPTLLQGIALRACEEVIVLSEYWKELIETETPASRVTVVPNGVDPSLFDSSPDSNPERVLFIARLVEVKGISELLTALDLLQSENVDFQVDIAGAGPLADVVRNYADKRDFVTYHGHISEAEKRTLLSSASIFVLPSHAEGLPIALLEAMAAGNATVATPVGSIPEVLDEGKGRLVPIGDPDSLAKELQSLLEAPQEIRTIGQSNRRLIKAKYSWSSIRKSLREIYGTHLTEAES